MMLAALLLLVPISHAALIAYDCRNPSTNLTAISLLDVSQCPDPDTGYSTQEGFVQILEKRRFEYVHVFSCLVEVTRLITYCGAFSHQSAVDGGISTYIFELGSEECRKTHSYRQFKGING